MQWATFLWCVTRSSQGRADTPLESSHQRASNGLKNVFSTHHGTQKSVLCASVVMCKSKAQVVIHTLMHSQVTVVPSARSASEQQRPPPVPARRRQPPPLLCATSPPFAPHSTLSVRTSQASSRTAACGSARRAGCPRRRHSPECPHTECQLAVGLGV